MPKNYNSMTHRNEISTSRRILAGALGTLMIFGFYHVVSDNEKASQATAQVTVGLPNFHGKTANQFIAESPQTKEGLKDGALVEVTIDNIPLPHVPGIKIPNSIDNLAWDISPKGADASNAVADALINNQNSKNGIDVEPGQNFIVNTTPGAVKLAKAEADQGIYPS